MGFGALNKSSSKNFFAALAPEEEAPTLNHDLPQTTGNADTKPRSVLVFVLGPPGAGKTALCEKLVAALNNLDHVSAAHYLSATDQAEDGKGGKEQTGKGKEKAKEDEEPQSIAQLMKDAIFPASPKKKKKTSIRCLVNGFPTSIPQWKEFRELSKNDWKPSHGTFLIAMDCNHFTCTERLAVEGKIVGEEFLQWQNGKEDLVRFMRGSIKGYVEVDMDGNNGDVERVVAKVVAELKANEEWKAIFGDGLE